MNSHRQISRRTLLQAGTIGLLGLDMAGLEAARADEKMQPGGAKNVLFIFLSGGLSQIDSFDMKPNAPVETRGEFSPISTATPGIQICEHLPNIARHMDKLALIRSVTHTSNEHNEAHTLMLTGRSILPPGWQEKKPQATDWPSISSIAGRLTSKGHTNRSGLPSAVVVPQRLLNMNQNGVVIPGQFAGQMGERYDPWFVEASPYRGGDVKGAYPDYAYCRRTESKVKDDSQFSAPVLSLPDGLTLSRIRNRLSLLNTIDRQRAALDSTENARKLGRFRQSVTSLLTDKKVRRAFDVVHAEKGTIDRYGDNLFGWTLLMARRLLEAGVTLVQANLGNFNTWDLHGGIFELSKNLLYPPADKAIAALLEDLSESGQLDDTLVVIASEFGRTPRIFKVPRAYKTPGRDHWGAVQTVLFAGAGVRGGNVIGASDRIGAYPVDAAKRPEDFAATIYSALGLPPKAAWLDDTDRPHFIYHGHPISELY